MLVFLDFEASSLGKHSYPIEVAWIFADGHSETHLIRPAPAWIDWDEEAQAIHGIMRETLVDHGTPHDLIAQRMIDQLTGHDLLASAPSWDGKWLSALPRAAGYPLHSLRLRRTAEALRECASSILAPNLADEDLAAAIEAILTRNENGASGEAPAYRALPDAQADRARWLAVCDAARQVAAEGWVSLKTYPWQGKVPLRPMGAISSSAGGSGACQTHPFPPTSGKTGSRVDDGAASGRNGSPRWGSNPRFSDGVAYRFVRSEGKTFPSHLCLIAASEFQLAVGKRRYRVTLDGGNFFYLAGVWEPAIGDWPLCYRIVTVDANPKSRSIRSGAARSFIGARSCNGSATRSPRAICW